MIEQWWFFDDQWLWTGDGWRLNATLGPYLATLQEAAQAPIISSTSYAPPPYRYARRYLWSPGAEQWHRWRIEKNFTR